MFRAILGRGVCRPGDASIIPRMPELPEVEVTRLGLVDRLEGAWVREVRLGKPLRWPLGIDPLALAGATVGTMQRRGKYLWLPLGACGGLLLHLGMSGSLRFGAASALPPAGPHDHFEMETDRGLLRLTDPRRFGAVVWSSALDAAPAATLLARLGVEPLLPAFSASVLQQGLRGRRVPIKQALLAGDIVVGVGNIYCSEALFAAGIDPRRAPARSTARPASGWSAPFARCCSARWPPAARRCATSATCTAWAAPSSCRRRSTAARASPAGSAPRRCSASCRASARPICVRTASA